MTRRFYRNSLTLVGSLLAIVFISGNPVTDAFDREHPFSPISVDAADSLLAILSLDEKIAQTFVLSKNESSRLTPSGFILGLDEIIQPGVNKFPVPLFIGMDMMNDKESRVRLQIPNQIALSSTGDPRLIHDYAKELGMQLQNGGYNFVLGPALDVEVNENDNSILDQSFGEDRDVVTESALTYVKGMRSSGVICVAGSFPGIGMAQQLVRNSNPTLYSSPPELIHRDLVPFKALVNSGAQSILLANVHAPAIDAQQERLVSNSGKAHELLEDKLGYHGLKWVDLRNPQGDQAYKKMLEASLIAGNDVIVVNEDLEKHVKIVKSLIKKGKLSEEKINQRCKRILQSKLWLKRNEPEMISVAEKADSNLLLLKSRQVIEKSFALARNRNNTLPLMRLDTSRIAVIKVGEEDNTDLEYLVQRYAPAEVFNLEFASLEDDFTEFERRSNEFNLVLLMIDETQEKLARKQFGMTEHAQSVIERVANTVNTVLIWNGNEKALRNLGEIKKLHTIIVGHQPLKWTDDLAIQAFFGGREINGRLRRNVNEEINKDLALSSPKTRLGYGLPEEVGISSEDLKVINQIAQKGIEAKAYPGAQVWFAKDGIVVINGAFGHHTYQEERAVSISDIYDIASITKISSSVAALMKLTDVGSFKLDDNLCDYIGDMVDTTAYMNMNLREMLAHQGGLTPFIPFYANTLTKGVPRYDVYSLAQSDLYPTRVAREIYIKKDYRKEIYQQILNHKVSSKKKYRYSDVGYYFTQEIIERLSKTTLDNFVDSTYYRPLGLTTMGYHPLNRFPKERITPTEFDRSFRHQLVHGDVHDPGAAMMGGVAGHAGIFSNANDLGILMQMYMNEGEYGYEHYLNPETLKDFIKCQFCDNDNRRGAGFDKPLRDGGNGPSCGCTHVEAFGHQGFTGAVTWADPQEHVVYVFLSNRIYPTANNKKLLELNIRTDIQEAFYKAISKSSPLANERTEQSTQN
ncbi:MAG: serine hydrolase [Flavobacteriales bacterium]|jgi:beta-N-acetylhexosaminidase|nr:serine hydrolase [Flavobacteriales bacterium]MBT5132510.1 serine hydrolase [Flavobacteriales bacterium]MBT5977236.1 serine hydrolase [Flavobacteriales bacterium]MBT6133177.1 serine hydrolase [Flavobacteriales bacterium]MBT6383616.1 serine hydrolase [Flavobacteriales bacterium]